MHGQRIGYIRVSTTDQHPDRQLDQIPVDRIFIDRASGKNTERPALDEMLAYIRQGDLLLVHSMDRLARNFDDLRRVVQQLTTKGVQVQFVKEGLTFTGEDSAMAKLMLTVMGGFAEFERSLIRERQQEGIALAKQKGIYKGRQHALTAQAAAELRAKAQAGISKAQLAREYQISRETVYAYLRA